MTKSLSSLRFGVATADHQCEAYDPRVPDIRDLWELQQGSTLRGRATDFWDRYAEDVGLARDLGCHVFRFSIAWSRVEPESGRFDHEAIEHYRSVAKAIVDAGMSPLVTLHHFTWPVHLQDRGGLLADDFPAIFRAYAAKMAESLGDLVGEWITFNEPNALPFGFIKFWWQPQYAAPPGLADASPTEQVEAVEKVIRNLFLAHTAARDAIRAAAPASKVGANPFILGLPTWFQAFADWKLCRMARRDNWVRSEVRAASPRATPSGGMDLALGALTTTTDRMRLALFSQPYAMGKPAFLISARAGSSVNLAGATAVVVAGTYQESLLRELLPAATARVVADRGAALAELTSGRADAYLSDDLILFGIVSRNQGVFRIVESDRPARPYAAAVALGDQSLLEQVNTAVCGFKESGAFAASFARHFPGVPLDVARQGGGGGELVGGHREPGSGATLQTIRQRGVLRVAIEEAPGFALRDASTGVWSGLDVDLAGAIAAQILGDPTKVEFRVVAAKARVGSLCSWLEKILMPVRKFFSTLSTAYNTNWWSLGMAGKLPEHLCPRQCVGQHDFVGLDYYWGIGTFQIQRIARLINAVEARYSGAPVWPAALNRILARHARLFPGMPISIIENGCVSEADGLTRAEYIERHIRQVDQARGQGVPVSLYTCWSITTNREWGLPLGVDSDFGLYRVDLDLDPDLKRVPTETSRLYQELIRAHGGPVRPSARANESEDGDPTSI